MNETIAIDNLYKVLLKNDEKSKEVKKVLCAQNWFYSIFDFDPVTNEPLLTTVDQILHNIKNLDVPSEDIWWNDRVENLIQYTYNAIYALLEDLKNKIFTEHIITHPSHIKETDNTAMRWICTKPGRTVKQKIAVTGKMMGVFHSSSIDTTENRLFKAFLIRLDDILYQKEKVAKKLAIAIPDQTERTISMIHRWILSDDAHLIGQWNHLPPNNTLLNDKNYRKIWKAWCSLQYIDDELVADIKNIPAISSFCYFWNYLAECSSSKSKKYCFLQSPIWKDPNKLQIFSCVTPIECLLIEGKTAVPLTFKLNHKNRLIEIKEQGDLISNEYLPKEISFVHIQNKHNQVQKKPSECAVFDLTTIKPSCIIKDGKSHQRMGKLIYQKWRSSVSPTEKKEIDIDVSCSNASHISKKRACMTITIQNFYEEDNSSEIVLQAPRAAQQFAETIKKTLPAKNYVYLVPDEVDDFSEMQKILRHQLNSHLKNIVPLPRSIAKIFSLFKEYPQKITSGSSFMIIDKYDGHWILTKIVAKADPRLLKENPSTNGIYFEHHPPTVLASKKSCDLFSNRDKNLLAGNFFIDNQELSQVPVDHHDLKNEYNTFKKDQKENFFYEEINSHDNLPCGALYYYTQQLITPDIPLWKEHLPSLQLEISGQKLTLVDNKTEGIIPKKGIAKEIEVKAQFEMPSGAPFYEFSLIQGKRSEKSKYFAYLIDSSFPLSQNVVCKLRLTYTYGDERPYNLFFEPTDAKKAPFTTINVRWENTSHKDNRCLPFPPFCQEYTWADMKYFSDAKVNKTKTRNFINDWLPREFEKITNFNIYKVKKKIGAVKNEKIDVPKDLVFLDRGKIDRKDARCYLPEEWTVQEGDLIFCSVLSISNGNYQGFDPIPVRLQDDDTISISFTKSLRFPMLTVWNNGRSLQDADVDNDFRNKALNAIEKAQELIEDQNTPKAIQKEMLFFLSYLHKDAPESFFSLLEDKFFPCINKREHYQYIAFAIGDAQLVWQKNALKKVIEGLEKNEIFSIASIKILAIILWRVKQLVFDFSLSDIQAIIKCCNRILEMKIITEKRNSGLCTSVLQVLLAVLRQRENASNEMLELLSPFYNQTLKKIESQILTLSKNKNFYTQLKNNRIEFDGLEKSEKEKDIPDLLYVVTKYLSGDIGGKSIKIIVSEA
ncbi:MAG: DUF2357 domain-containing protein [Treponemataceae bacterium]